MVTPVPDVLWTVKTFKVNTSVKPMNVRSFGNKIMSEPPKSEAVGISKLMLSLAYQWERVTRIICGKCVLIPPYCFMPGRCTV